ncbi:hypothetical protein [Actinoallomurus iriomotensis]|uniref:hypothetical protein n=1 Tax=Actinoallomurus iriomotensis TaxID=478107 RepID=UPI002552CA02|nr:hypothetical protein [Actinoallomurus iriomotensis]
MRIEQPGRPVGAVELSATPAAARRSAEELRAVGTELSSRSPAWSPVAAAGKRGDWASAYAVVSVLIPDRRNGAAPNPGVAVIEPGRSVGSSWVWLPVRCGAWWTSWAWLVGAGLSGRAVRSPVWSPGAAGRHGGRAGAYAVVSV